MPLTKEQLSTMSKCTKDYQNAKGYVMSPNGDAGISVLEGLAVETSEKVNEAVMKYTQVNENNQAMTRAA